MKTSWFIGLFFLFVCMQILTSIATGGGLLPETGGDFNTGSMSSLLRPSGIDVSNPLIGIVSVVTGVWTYFKLMINMLTWNYPTLFVGNWVLVKYIVFLPLSIAMVASFIMVLRGSSSS